MKILLTGSFILIATCLLAQQKPYVVKRDTINLNGYVYDHTGKAVNFIRVESTQLETEHNTFKLGTYTNERGYFELKGARFNDTLTVGPDINYDIPKYYNEGSRSLLIYLPPAKVRSINGSSPLVITQKRKYAKVTPLFTVTPVARVADINAGMMVAEYTGGLQQLQDFIKQNIQYPQAALKANAEGMVQVSFTVTKEGTHRDFKVLRGIGFDCDDEVIRVLKKSERWKPALDNNQAVAVQEIIEVQFKLTDN